VRIFASEWHDDIKGIGRRKEHVEELIVQLDSPDLCQYILPGDWLFKHLILKPDTAAGIRSYEANKDRSN